MGAAQIVQAVEALDRSSAIPGYIWQIDVVRRKMTTSTVVRVTIAAVRFTSIRGNPKLCRDTSGAGLFVAASCQPSIGVSHGTWQPSRFFI